MIVNLNVGRVPVVAVFFAMLGGAVAACSGGSGDPDGGDGAVHEHDASVSFPDAAVLCAPGAPEPVYPELDQSPTGDARRDATIAIATNVIIPMLRDLERSLIALVCATRSYKDAPTDPAAQAAAQDAWRDAMRAMQRVNLVEVGPAGPPGVVVGGQGLGDEIYAWPLINRCKIDQTIVSRDYENVETVGGYSVNARGLGAIEYLLFPLPDNANSCPANDPINMFNMWILVNDMNARRGTYAHHAALQALYQATRLRAEWEPNAGDYLRFVRDPSVSGSPYSSSQQVLNAMSDAIFYLYSETRDMKVAYPAGINSLDGPQPSFVESTNSDTALAHIRTNIEAFRETFTGGPPGSTNLGFDDLLVQMGQGSVATDMIARTDAALAACDAVTGPLEAAVIDNPAQVQALYDALKGVSDLLKADFISVLGLQAPMGAAGDND